jgi:hypothetical protein
MRVSLISAARYLLQSLFNGLPAILASIAGALVMSYVHWGAAAPSAPISPPAAQASLETAQTDLAIAQMVKQEHALIIDFLKKEEAARQAADAKAKPMLSKLAEAKPPLPPAKPQSRPAARAKLALRERRAPARDLIATYESGPAVAPAPEREAQAPTQAPVAPEPGLAARVLEATHLPDVAAFVLDIPSRLRRTMDEVTVAREIPTVRLAHAGW